MNSIFIRYERPPVNVISSDAPRQIEYHPRVPGIMVIGSMMGSAKIIDMESQDVIGDFSINRE